MGAHDDEWVARIRREHERHAGIPDYGYCPGRMPRRPDIPVINHRQVRATLRAGRRIGMPEGVANRIGGVSWREREAGSPPYWNPPTLITPAMVAGQRAEYLT